MKVSIGSWHYRLLGWTYGRVPNNLCPYANELAKDPVEARSAIYFLLGAIAGYKMKEGSL